MLASALCSRHGKSRVVFKPLGLCRLPCKYFRVVFQSASATACLTPRYVVTATSSQCSLRNLCTCSIRGEPCFFDSTKTNWPKTTDSKIQGEEIGRYKHFQVLIILYFWRRLLLCGEVNHGDTRFWKVCDLVGEVPSENAFICHETDGDAASATR